MTSYVSATWNGLGLQLRLGYKGEQFSFLVASLLCLDHTAFLRQWIQ